MIEYETLRIIWWLLIGVLLAGFAITDGFDLGVGALLRLVGKTDDQRRLMINTIGPHWDGNQVWFVTTGGAIFAAWPLIYATAFSGFYIALFLTLAALWMRPLGFDYRSKVDNPKWRNAWDWALFTGGLIPALIFGVAFGNLLIGVPFHFDPSLKVTYTGHFFGLLNPFAILTGLISVAMLLMHGGTWLQMKTEGQLLQQSRNVTIWLAVATTATFALAGVWLAIGIDGYTIVGTLDTAAASNPLMKTVEKVHAGWLSNYGSHPWMIAAPVIGLLAPIGVLLFTKKHRCGLAFVASALTQIGIIFTAGLSMFPFLMPSSSHPNMSLTIWDATSSQLTLSIMLVVALILVPIVLGYTAWCFWVMRGRLKERDLASKTSRVTY